MTKSSHAIAPVSDYPTPAQMEEFWKQVRRGQITKGRFQQFLRAKAHLIDCSANPFLPQGWKVENHKKDGSLEWNPAKVRLHLSPNQQNGKVISGNELRKELANEPVLNANVLDYLLTHPELIPEEWKGKYVFFWGTIYRRSAGYLDVRCLHWDGHYWDWDFYWLGGDWRSSRPAVCSQVSS